MAARVGLRQSAVVRIWHAFGLHPHRVATFTLFDDPRFIESVRDIVARYLAPPDHALVLRVDEEPQIQATEGTTSIVPLCPGQPERHGHDYVRHGTTDRFAPLDEKAGTVIGDVHRRHRSRGFRQFLGTVERWTTADLALHVVLDDASAYETPLIHRYSRAIHACTWDFTPPSGAWLRLVAGWFSLRTRRRMAPSRAPARWSRP